MIKIYPFASGSEVTASFAVTSSYAGTADYVQYVYTASMAKKVLYPQEGDPAPVNICFITYEQYLDLLNNPGTRVEQCVF